MKLSTLVHYRNLLRQSNPGDMNQVLYTHAGQFLKFIRDHEIQFEELSTKIRNDYENIAKAFLTFSATAKEVEQQVQELIWQNEQPYYKESYRLYNEEFNRDSSSYILGKKLSLSEDSCSYINGRLQFHGNWRYPALIIRPGLENWINHLVAFDPLYLADQRRDLIDPIVSTFNPVYQKKLRLYEISETMAGSILDALPNSQFAFCFAFNFFNYKPIEMIKIYINELFTKMKPGGIIGFTFNNCDNAEGVELVEKNFMCYTPGQTVISLVESLGFDIVQNQQLDSACTWLEIKKPGTLTTMRGGQNLAKIVAKSK